MLSSYGMASGLPTFMGTPRRLARKIDPFGASQDAEHGDGVSGSRQTAETSV
jgi:hypothetical protein